MLAKGGFLIEEIARQRFPEGVAVPFDVSISEAIAATQELIEDAANQDITLFEPTFEWNGRLARVDIFRKLGDSIELIEVKAKSWPPKKETYWQEHRKALLGSWIPYLEDVTYQSIILSKLFPSHRIVPYLMMPDTNRVATQELEFDNFRIDVVESRSGKKNYCVKYIGEKIPTGASDFLALVNIQDAVSHLWDEVESHATQYVDSLRPLTRIPISPHPGCAKCEYRLGEGGDGFSVCWGEKAKQSNHILDLYQVSRATHAQTLIDEGYCLTDVTPDWLVTSKGVPGTLDKRRDIQIKHTKNGSEWIHPDMKGWLKGHSYPHHFIDFEASTMAVPYHAGMRPYQKVAFQWSCHTVDYLGDSPRHGEWINTVDRTPNVEFARTLRDHIGNDGTVFIWSGFENTTLRHIADELIALDTDDHALLNWLEELVIRQKGDRSRFVDMYKYCVEGYFHPRMGPRTGIKYALDAVWHESERVRTLWKQYVDLSSGELASPYRSLENSIRVGNTDLDVSDGTSAMRAYEAMMYGVERDKPEVREQIRNRLLAYCKLDTEAMMMIWEHWHVQCGLSYFPASLSNE